VTKTTLHHLERSENKKAGGEHGESRTERFGRTSGKKPEGDVYIVGAGGRKFGIQEVTMPRLHDQSVEGGEKRSSSR